MCARVCARVHAWGGFEGQLCVILLAGQESSGISLSVFKIECTWRNAATWRSVGRVTAFALPVSLATGTFTCCSAAAGSWQAARKHPAATRFHILFVASAIIPASRDSHLPFFASPQILCWFSKTSRMPTRGLMTRVARAVRVRERKIAQSGGRASESQRKTPRGGEGRRPCHEALAC